MYEQTLRLVPISSFEEKTHLFNSKWAKTAKYKTLQVHIVIKGQNLYRYERSAEQEL